MVQKVFTKGSFNCSGDGIPDLLKESSVNKSKEKYTTKSLKYM